MSKLPNGYRIQKPYEGPCGRTFFTTDPLKTRCDDCLKREGPEAKATFRLRWLL